MLRRLEGWKSIGKVSEIQMNSLKGTVTFFVGSFVLTISKTALILGGVNDFKEGMNIQFPNDYFGDLAGPDSIILDGIEVPLKIDKTIIEDKNPESNPLFIQLIIETKKAIVEAKFPGILETQKEDIDPNYELFLLDFLERLPVAFSSLDEVYIAYQGTFTVRTKNQLDTAYKSALWVAYTFNPEVFDNSYDSDNIHKNAMEYTDASSK